MWLFVIASTIFAHLASFQAIELVDWPIPKTLDIFVCQTSKNKAFFTKCGILLLLFAKVQWCVHTWIFRCTVKNLVAYATSWSLTLRPALKEHCHRNFAVFSFICCWNLCLVPLLVPKMLKWTNRNISNEWWLREQTIMNFWQYFQGMALEFEKNWLVFSNFNPLPSLPC